MKDNIRTNSMGKLTAYLEKKYGSIERMKCEKKAQAKVAKSNRRLWKQE